MKKNRSLANIFENLIVYIALLLVIIISVLDYVFPNVSIFENSNGYMALFSAAMLLMYSKINSVDKNRESIKTLKTFSAGLSELLDCYKKIDSLQIYAHTGYSYYNTVRQNDIKIKRVQLIVCDDFSDDCIAVHFKNDARRKEVKKEFELSINYWQSLVQLGQIESLEIRKMKTIPAFHFSIVNGGQVVFGFFSTNCSDLSRHNSMNDYSFSNQHDLISDYSSLFLQYFTVATPINLEDKL